MNSVLYDLIPDGMMNGTILDLGCGDLNSQLNSRHRERFIKASDEGKYLGIDLNPDDRLETVSCDVLDLMELLSSDLVLLIEVAEHIEYNRWSFLFEYALSCVRPEGTLVVSTSYNEPVDGGMTSPDDPCPHVVFNISSKTLNEFMPNSTLYRYIGNSTQRVGRIPFVKIRKPTWIVGMYTKETKK